MDLTLSLSVDPQSAVPPYEQLRRQIAKQIMNHELAAGDRLPPVRRLAEQLGMAANTVARVYRELEANGYVITRGRAGTFISDIAPADPQAAGTAAALSTTYVADLRALGFGPTVISQFVTEALRGTSE
ncbi:GntR family transcriptional regulator [Leucobacter sp. cx-328]|uniref:GntR family transcriptional regulator n=1 Tax=unclassified Leucobacter TaxID=2621730 RepID=UPI00165E60CC|nr:MULTISPECIES: GntR family transcriptional regulator [unclassified Leucobacter]MBC9944138.1 GntR family transcriptional regulator [Leucobacter sp. cx-328]